MYDSSTWVSRKGKIMGQQTSGMQGHPGAEMWGGSDDEGTWENLGCDGPVLHLDCGGNCMTTCLLKLSTD